MPRRRTVCAARSGDPNGREQMAAMSGDEGDMEAMLASAAGLTSAMAGGATAASSGAAAGGSNVDVSALPIRAFLDQSVVPVLLQGLCALVRERCVPAAGFTRTAHRSRLRCASATH